MAGRIIYSAAIMLTVVNIAAFGTLLYTRWSDTEQPPAKTEQRFEHMKRELALSQEQTAQLQVYRTTFHAELDSLSLQLVNKKKELTQALWQEQLDTARINIIVNDIGHVQNNAQKKVVAHLLTVKSMLNPDQQQKFYTIVLERFATELDQPMHRYRQDRDAPHK